MKEEIVRYSAPVKYFFFLAGLIATLAYRVVIVLNFYSPLWVKISWYIGTGGFILYFGYQYSVEARERNIILDYGLAKMIRDDKKIKGKQRQALNYVINTSVNSKARWNSLLICLLSIFALIVGIVLDAGVFG